MRYFNHPSSKNTYYEFRGMVSKNARRKFLTSSHEHFPRKGKDEIKSRKTKISVGIQPGSYHRYQALLEVAKIV